ncbi:MAG: hypothetical protein BWY83_01163 [bacterium ADurb.Bin478]|nr:MAG: hypothetical protein BWY83_01163 [bacterium ADurb.Bin478]
MAILNEHRTFYPCAMRVDEGVVYVRLFKLRKVRRIGTDAVFKAIQRTGLGQSVQIKKKLAAAAYMKESTVGKQ